MNIAEMQAQAALFGHEAAFVANVIATRHRNRARKLRGLLRLLEAGHDVRTRQFDSDTVIVDGRRVAWEFFETVPALTFQTLRGARMKTKIVTPSQEVGMNFLDALAKLGRVLDYVEQCDLQNQFPVPVCLYTENAVMARMRLVLAEVDSRISKMCERNSELIREWERKG